MCDGLEITNQEITFKTSDGKELAAYFSKPKASGQYPGIIVIHEVWGVNEQIKGVTRRYSEQGFVAIAPNLFSRNGDVMTEKNIERVMMPMFSIPPEKRNDPATMDNMMKKMSDVDRKVVNLFFTGREAFEKQAVSDLMTCTTFLRSTSSVRGDRLGITGFRMGGGLTYQASTMYPFNAAVPYYGANPKPLESVSTITGPVFGIYAGEGERINSGIPALVENMIRRKKSFEMKIYKGAQHSFFNETKPTYDRPAAEDAWEKTVSFFNKHLRQ